MPQSKNRRKNGKPAAKRVQKPQKKTIIRFAEKPFLRYNGYICETCEGMYVTVDLDEGVTPMFSPCLATEACTGTAHSLGYPDSPPPKGYPVILEWYKPNPADRVPKAAFSPALAHHLDNGGLMRRVTKEAPAWVKEKLNA